MSPFPSEQIFVFRTSVCGAALRDRIEEGSVLCSDGFSTYKNVARDASVATRVFFPKYAKSTVKQSLKGALQLGNGKRHKHPVEVLRQSRGERCFGTAFSRVSQVDPSCLKARPQGESCDEPTFKKVFQH